MASIGLYFYNSRFYDAQLGRFVSPDSIIPNPSDPVSYDRFAYVRNNTLRYVDPTGHRLCEGHMFCEPIPKKISLQFQRLPVDESDLSWLQWFGATDFAYSDHKNYINGRDNYNYDGYCQGMHCGIDFGADWGDPVYAGIDGRVIYTSDPNSGGNFTIVIRYGDYLVRYEHLSSMGVEKNAIVGPNTLIGNVGNPAGNNSGDNNHLHLEVRHDADNDAGRWAELVENPLDFMSVQQIQVLQVRADEIIGSSPNNYDPLLSFSYWYTKDIFSQPNPIHIGGAVLWR